MNILIIKPSSLGDIIHGLQVAQSIKAQTPEAHMTWVARELFAPLVEDCACVDEVIVFQRNQGFAGLRQAIREIREHEYDLVLDFQGLARSGLMTAAARSLHKAGRRDHRELGGLGYGAMPEYPPAGRESHALDILLQFLPLMKLEPTLAGPLAFHAIDAPHLPAQAKGAIVMFPGSRRAEKEWQGFNELTARLLKANPEASIVWAGDVAVNADSAWPAERFSNLTGKTELPELVPLIREARLCVCNDSGPMHLAAALGTELVAIFGPTKAKRFGPWPLDNPRHHVIEAPSGDLAKLDVDAVLAKVAAALAAD